MTEKPPEYTAKCASDAALYLRACARAHEPGVLLLGNMPALDIVALCDMFFTIAAAFEAQTTVLDRVRAVVANAEARVAQYPGLKGSTYYAAYLETLAILAEAEESQPRTAAPTPNPVTRYNTDLEEKHAALMARNAEISQQLLRAEHGKTAAYTERNRLVAFLARLYPSGLRRTDIPGWDECWHGCVFIDTPEGQMSWHYHDDDAGLFAGLPPYEAPWDGHATPEKYERLERLCARMSGKLPP